MIYNQKLGIVKYRRQSKSLLKLIDNFNKVDNQLIDVNKSITSIELLISSTQSKLDSLEEKNKNYDKQISKIHDKINGISKENIKLQNNKILKILIIKIN